MKYISEDRIVFWTVFSLLFVGGSVSLYIFVGGILYNLIVSFLANRALTKALTKTKVQS